MSGIFPSLRDTKKERQTGEDQQPKLPARRPGRGHVTRWVFRVFRAQEVRDAFAPKIASLNTWPDGTITGKKGWHPATVFTSGPPGRVQMQKIYSPLGINKAFSFVEGNLKMGNCQIAEQRFRKSAATTA